MFSDKKPFFGKASDSAAALRQYLPYSAAATSHTISPHHSHSPPTNKSSFDTSSGSPAVVGVGAAASPLDKFSPDKTAAGVGSGVKSEPGSGSLPSSLYSSHYHRLLHHNNEKYEGHTSHSSHPHQDTAGTPQLPHLTPAPSFAASAAAAAAMDVHHAAMSSYDDFKYPHQQQQAHSGHSNSSSSHQSPQAYPVAGHVPGPQSGAAAHHGYFPYHPATGLTASDTHAAAAAAAHHKLNLQT